ncbi:exopolysaccharide synthesis, ExoD [Acetobacteraceae bacterium AT-5844]|nr:exopolysaccharide synthesis, ExoD [Acetobacteraceae bacterium AT-5844]
MLDELLASTPGEQVTLEWFMDRLGDRSFGLVLLLLAFLGMLPGVSTIASLLLMVTASQMLLARPHPIFPRSVAKRSFEVRRLARIVGRFLPVLRWFERFVRPRWVTPLEATKRTVGGVVLLLAGGLLTPVPLSNIPLALTIALIAFAYLEEDGVLLCAALAVALAGLAATVIVAWGTLNATGWVLSLL